jgi:hypothetical protein
MESTIVTTEVLKTLTSIGQNIDVELLNPHLLIAQQLYVAPVLGTALYDDIVSRFDNNTLTGDTLTLYEDYIVPAIAYSAWFSVSPFLNYKTQRAGIQTTASPDSTPVTPEELSLYIARVENYKNFYCKRLNDYLILDNYVKFPLFRSDDTPQNLSKGSSLYLGFGKTKSTTCCNKQWWQ